MLDPLDVILIFDGLIEPPHPKMVVCVFSRTRVGSTVSTPGRS